MLKELRSINVYAFFNVCVLQKIVLKFFFLDLFVFFIKFKQSSNTLVGAVAGATEQFGWDIWKNQRVAEGLWEESALGQ